MDKHLLKNKKKLISEHIRERDLFEKKFFKKYLKKRINKKMINFHGKDYLSSDIFLNQIIKLKPDLILVYGTSIIKGNFIKIFDKKIINIHLGLSPYYRGSGTNFFPFVNNEPEFCGVTFMFLDAGVDTGNIIHQIRPNIKAFDNFHEICNKLLSEMFDITKLLIKNFHKIKNKKQTNVKNFRYYKTKDFNDNTVKRLRKNFKNGMLKSYLLNKVIRDKRVKIINQNF